MSPHAPDHRSLPEREAGRAPGRLHKVIVTGDGSFHPKKQAGSWVSVFRSLHEQRPPVLEIARGRVDGNTTSTKMEIRALQEGIERLPRSRPKGLVIEAHTDFLHAVQTLEKALDPSRPNWKEEIRYLRHSREYIALGNQLLALENQGINVFLRHITKKEQTIDHKICHKAANQLLKNKTELALKEKEHFSRHLRRATSETEWSI